MNRGLRRVVITGLGMVSPLGANVPTSWQALISGNSGIVAIETLPECQNSSFPSSIYIAPVHKSFDKSKYKIPVSLFSYPFLILFLEVYANIDECFFVCSSRGSFEFSKMDNSNFRSHTNWGFNRFHEHKSSQVNGIPCERNSKRI